MQWSFAAHKPLWMYLQPWRHKFSADPCQNQHILYETGFTMFRVSSTPILDKKENPTLPLSPQPCRDGVMEYHCFSMPPPTTLILFTRFKACCCNNVESLELGRFRAGNDHGRLLKVSSPNFDMIQLIEVKYPPQDPLRFDPHNYWYQLYFVNFQLDLPPSSNS